MDKVNYEMAHSPKEVKLSGIQANLFLYGIPTHHILKYIKEHRAEYEEFIRMENERQRADYEKVY